MCRGTRGALGLRRPFQRVVGFAPAAVALPVADGVAASMALGASLDPGASLGTDGDGAAPGWAPGVAVPGRGGSESAPVRVGTSVSADALEVVVPGAGMARQRLLATAATRITPNRAPSGNV
jgi:hypothetical protein